MHTTWVLTLIWIVWGVLMYRKRQIAEQRLQLQKTAATCKAKSRPSPRREKSETSVLRQTVTRDELSMPTQAVNLTRSDLIDSTLASTSASTSNPSDNNQPAAGNESLGLDAPGYKRFRTLLVTNIPPLMRNETTLAEYFTEHLSKNKASNEWKEIVPDFVKRQLDRTQEFVTTPRASFQGERDPASRAGSILNGATGIAQGLGLRTLAFYGEVDDSIVEDVILVRKLGELGALRQRRDDVIARLETVRTAAS
ncbi:hypothetical protein QFC22_002456 [Naganishia vaughanmartiniae]|uniref:Uncharacterized protein n=1 Tax=Naganishia vaughanmartiniae TaxID=1424756 RepID=A0ACC2XDZ5_9TREE|nr:hypothetical protein QFC22_002456 [Naganishia vaughanmartiniae]